MWVLSKRFFPICFIAVLFLTTALFIAPQKAAATSGVPYLINFQGKVTNLNGTNVSNGSYSFVFKIYNVSSGGAALWTETQTLTTTDGIFQANLDSVAANNFSGVDFGTFPLYLGVTFNGDPEMSPRIQLTSAPYALNSDKLGDISASGFVQLGPAAAQADASTNSSIFINKTGASGNILQLQNNNGGSPINVFTVSNTGSVNIQTQTNSSGAFAVQNAGGTTLLNFDNTPANVSLNENIGNINILGVANPATPTLTSSGSGGSLTAGTYLYQLAAQGKTGVYTTAIASSPASVTTSGSASKNTLTWTGVPFATGYIVYRSINGGTNWFSNTVSSGTTSLVDDGTAFTWATSASPQSYNATGGFNIQKDTFLTFDGGTGSFNASVHYQSLFNQLVFGNYNSGGSLVYQADSLKFQDSTAFATEFSVNNTGQTVFENRTDSGTAFEIQNHNASSNLFVADTTHSEIGIGKLPSGSGATLQVSGTTDSTTGFSFNGTGGSTVTCSSGNYLNSQVVQGGIITSGTCASAGGGSGTLQNAYDTSAGGATPEIKLNNGGTDTGGIQITDNATPIGADLFDIQNSAQTVTFFGVAAGTTSINGLTSGSADTLDVSNNGSTGNIAVFKNNTTAVATIGNGGLITLQPAANLTSGQTHISETLTNGSTSGGTIQGIAQTVTVNNTTTASNTTAHAITITDSTAGSLVNVNTGLAITLNGTNTSQQQVGVSVNVNNGEGLNVITTGFATGQSLCGFSAEAVTVCGDSQSTSANHGIGITGRVAASGNSITSNAGSGVIGVVNTSATQGAGNFYRGIKGDAELSSNTNAYTTIGVQGIASGGTNATVYGGYFLNTSGGNNAGGSVLYASNGSTATQQVFELQHNATDVFTVGGNGQVSSINSTNSATAYQIQNATGDQELSVDTTTINLLANPSIEQALSGTNWQTKGTTTTFQQTSSQAYIGSNSLQIVTTATVDQGAKQNLTLTNATSYALSFEAKLDAASTTTFTTLAAGYSSTGSTDDTPCTGFNTTSATATGWTRVTCTFTTPGSHSGTPYVYIKQSDAKVRTFYLDAIQLEQTTGSATAFTDGRITLNGVVVSPVVFKNANDSNNSFQIQNTSGVSLLTADTANVQLNLVRTVFSGNPLGSISASQSSTSKVITGIDLANADGVTNDHSVAVGSDGLPVLVYRTSTGNPGLRFVHCNNESCTTWTTTTLDTSSGNQGQYASVTIGKDGYPVIAYGDVTNHQVHVAKCYTLTCSSETSNTVDTVTAGAGVNYWTTVSIGADGNPIVTYEDPNATVALMKIAHCNAPDCSGSTDVTTLDGDGVGGNSTDATAMSSNAIGTDGLAVATWYDSTGQDLKFVHCTNTSCTTRGTTLSLDTAGIKGQYPRVAIGADGDPIISYRDSANSTLRILHCGNTTCTANNSISSPDGTANVTGNYDSIAIGLDGLPIVSYYDSTNKILKAVKCGNLQCTTGNTVSIVDNTTSADIGADSSITILPDGLPFISEGDNSTANEHFYVVRCGNPSCSATGTTQTGGLSLGALGDQFQTAYIQSIRTSDTVNPFTIATNNATHFTIDGAGNTTVNAPTFNVQDQYSSTIFKADTTNATVSVNSTQVDTGGITSGLLSTPSAPTVTPVGTTGAATWTYAISAVNANGGETLASSGGSTTTGDATLSVNNLNRITWTPVAGAKQYKIYRTAHGTSPATNGLIGTVTSTNTFDDTGIATSSSSTGATYDNSANVLIDSSGDITGTPTQLTGSTTANGSGTNSTTLILTSATGFVIGNYVQVSSTSCAASVNICFAKITNIATNTLTITPALTWANASPVTQWHLPEIGGIDTSQTLANRFGRGYFIAGVATGNGTTYYNEDQIQSALTNYAINLTDASAATLTLGNTSTGTTSLTLTNGNINLTAGDINLASGHKVIVNGTNGATVTCSAGNYLNSEVVVGGIVTGGSCSAVGGGGGTLQSDYTADSAGNDIVLDTTRNGIQIQDASGTPVTGDLFDLQNNGASVTYFGVSSTAVQITDGITQTGGAVSLTGNATSSFTTGTGNLTLDATSGSTPSINIGTGAQAKTIQIGINGTNTSNTQTINVGNQGSAGTTNVSIGAGTGATAGSTTITSKTATTLDSFGTVGVGNTNSTAVTVGNSSGTVILQGNGTSSAVAVQSAANGTISIGTSAIAGQTIQIGTTTINTGNTQTIGLGNLNAAGTTNVTVGTGGSATGGTTAIQGKTAVTVDSNGTVGVGNTNSTAVTVGNSSGTVIIQGNGTSSAVAVQSAANGTIAVGTSAIAGQTIQIGTTTINTGNTQVIAIGNLNAAGTTNVTIGTGSSATGGTTTILGKTAITVTAGGASTWSTSSGLLTIQGTAGLTLNSIGTTTATLDSTGAGTVNVGAANATTLGIGNITAATITTIQGGTTAAGAVIIQTGANGGINIGNNAVANTIRIGTTLTNTGNTQTISIGLQNNAGTTNVNIGALAGATAGTTQIQSKGTLSLGNVISPTINIQSASGGTVTLGDNAIADTIQIGDSTVLNTGNTQTIGLGNLTVAGTTNVTVGASTGATAGTTLIQSKSGTTIDSGNGTIIIGTNTTTLQKAATALALDLTNASNSTLTVTNSGGGTAFINSKGGYQFNGTAGSTVTCGAGNYLNSQVVQGGIITSGSCSAVGGGSGTLQTDYNNAVAGTTPEIILGTNSNGIQITDNATPIGVDLFDIQNSAQTTNYLSVTAGKVGVNLTSAPTEALDVNGTIRVRAALEQGLGTQLDWNDQCDPSGSCSDVYRQTGSAFSILQNDGAGALQFYAQVSGTAGASINYSNPVLQLTTTGQAVFRNNTNSTTAFQIQNSAGNALVRVDTTDSNLITNPGFETTVSTNWVAERSGGAAPTQDTSNEYLGLAAGTVSATTAKDGFQQTLSTTLTASTTYTLSFYAKQISGTAFTTLAATYDFNSTVGNEAACSNFNSTSVTTAGWARYQCEFTTGSSGTAPTGTNYIGIYQTDTATRVWDIDAVQLETGSTATSYGAGTISLNSNITSPVNFKNIQDSNTAFQVTDANNNNVLDIDTLDGNQNNLVTNPSFESTGTTGWAAKGSAAIAQVSTMLNGSSINAQNGTHALKITTTALASDGAKFPVTMVSGTSYSLSFYVKSDPANGIMSTISMGRADNGSTDTDCLTAQKINPSGWTRLSCTFTAGTQSGSPYIYIKQSDAVIHNFYIDAVLLQTDATADANYRDGYISLQGATINSDVQVQTAVNSSTAFVVQNASGAQVFAVSTTTPNNLIQNPGFEVNMAGWSLRGSATLLGRDTTQSYSGIASGTFKPTTAAGGADGVKYSLPTSPTNLMVSGTTYALSFYARAAGTITTLVAGRADNGSTETACTLAPVGTPATTGWTRYSCSFTAGAQSGTPYIYIGATVSVTAVMNIDGVQLEAAAAATDYGIGTIAINAVITSPVTIESNQNSTTAFQVQNATGVNLLAIDTLNSTVNIANSVASLTVDIGSTALSSGTQTINIGSSNTSGGTQNINIGTGTTSTAGTTTILGKSGVTITAGAASTWSTGTGNLTIQSTASSTTLALATGSTGTITIGSANATTVNLGIGNVAHGINIGTGATSTAQTIVIGSTGTSATSTVKIFAGSTSTAGGPSVTLTATGGAGAVCSSLGAGATPVAGTAYVLEDCSSTPAADFAEEYPTASNVQVGDLLMEGTQQVETYNIDSSENPDWNSPKGTVAQVVKATTPYDPKIIGVESDNYLDFVSTGYNIKPADNPKSVALVGRVLINVTNENGDIEPGDFLTASTTKPGYAMKATQSGYVVGQALAPFNGTSGQVMVFVRVQYYPGPTVAQDIQNGGDASLASLTVNGNTALNDLSVTGNTTIASLNVSGAAQVQDLTVVDSLTANTVTIADSLTVPNLIVGNGIQLGSNTEDPTVPTAHPITKSFKASKAIPIGAVVVLDVSAGNGWVTTTTTAGSRLVVGIATTAASAQGDTIKVAISGTAFANLSGSATIGDLVHTDSTAGDVSTVTNPTPGELVGKVISTPASGQALILITLQ
jgi:hypothetical protein